MRLCPRVLSSFPVASSRSEARRRAGLCQPGQVQRWHTLRPTSLLFPWHSTSVWEWGADSVSPVYPSKMRLVYMICW